MLRLKVVRVADDVSTHFRSFHSTEINFLCVHKKLRSKRLAPVLIKEVTRACHSSGVFQAIYTGGIVIPTPISCARYYHRTINASKLIDVGFTAVPQGMPRSSFEARYQLPKETRTKGLRKMEQKDVKAVGKLMRRFVRKYDMAPRFTDQEVEHLLLSGRGDPKTGKDRVVWAYVVEVSMCASVLFCRSADPSTICRTTMAKSQTCSRSTACRRQSWTMPSTRF